MIELVNVTKRYKKNRGVQQVNFSLQPGQITALVGANGAGKSTIIKLLTSQIQADEGTINGVEKEQLRYMPDDLTFPDTLTAKEILSLLGQLKKIDTNTKKAVLEQVGLAEASHLKVSQYSKGMRQRLNLAQSLLGNGSLYILDEPTNGLDPFWIATLKHILVKQKEEGDVVLFSTHLLNFAQEIADQIVMIHEGNVLVQGKIEDLLQQYQCETLEQLWLLLTKKDVLL